MPTDSAREYKAPSGQRRQRLLPKAGKTGARWCVEKAQGIFGEWHVVWLV